jgi:MFS family permease
MNNNHLKNLSRNIKRNYLFLGVSYIHLTQGLWMIWLGIQGYSLTQLGLLEGVFHLTSFLMEVPTGLVADLRGRKASRFWGRVMFFFSLVILYYGKSFPIQAAGFMLCAIGYNLESGAGEALIYDTLKELNREKEYKRIAGINNLIFEGGAIVSFLAGGWCAHNLGYAWVFFPAFTLAFLSCLCACLFTEPTLAQEEKNRLSQLGWGKAIKEQTLQSIIVIREKPRIAFLILFVELISMFTTSLYFYLQTFWKGSGKNELSIGFILACGSVISAVAGLKAEWLEKKIGPERVLPIFPIILIVCLWGIAATPWAPFFYCLTGFVDGMLYVAVQDYLNRLIPSERRATILSFQSMAFSLYMIVFFPLIGATGDRWGLETAFIGLALTASILYLIFLGIGKISTNLKSPKKG